MVEKNNKTEEKSSSDEFKFLLECVKAMGTDRVVDIELVKEALGYKNTASVGNRFRAFRKTYGLENFDCKNTGGTKKAAGGVTKPAKAKANTGSRVSKGAKARSRPVPATDSDEPLEDKDTAPSEAEVESNPKVVVEVKKSTGIGRKKRVVATA